MRGRFDGEKGKGLLRDAMRRQTVLRDAQDLIDRLIEAGSVEDVEAGHILIEEGGTDTDAFFILAGTFEIRVKGNVRATRYAGDLVGEISGVNPANKRSATVIATDVGAVLRLSLEALKEITAEHAGFWQGMNEQTTERLLEQHAKVDECNDIPSVIIFSSKEASLVVGQLLINLQRDKRVAAEAWDQVFALSGYPINSLVAALQRSDFAIAIASADDVLASRGTTAPAPRDNVNFEFGLAVGILGLDRSILLVQDGHNLRLASDLGGLTQLRYSSDSEKEMKRTVRVESEKMLEHIRTFKVRPR